MTVKQAFQILLGSPPYQHQVDAWSALAQGKPVVVRAPTGSGKTEAVFLPFACDAFPSPLPRLLYALPLRSLANQLKERLEHYVNSLGKTGWRVRLQHGEAPESVLFAADVVVTTIDQLITSYACTPLTLPVRHGNIPAGAVVSSFVVFDEVHLFDPLRALQATRLICKRLRKLGLPFALISATLPDCVLEFWQNAFECEVVEVDKEVIERCVKWQMEDRPLNADTVIQAMKNGHNRILAVLNTVDRAVDLFKQVKEAARQMGYELQLLHSRFLPSDRQDKEVWVTKRFGKEATETRSLLIATQVVEAGLDISADCVLTELAPIDALVQRAGRCARWGGSGTVFIFPTEEPAPYDIALLQKTEEVLQRNLPTSPSWAKAKEWVNTVLNDRYQQALEGQNYQQVVTDLSLAAFTGCRQRAARSVRETDTVEVTVHEKPQTLNKDALRLPYISVHIGVVRKWLKQAKGMGEKVWRVEVDYRASDIDGQAKVKLSPVTEHKLRLGDRLVFSTSTLTYDAELGLRSIAEEKRGQGQGFHAIPSQSWGPPSITLQKETWIEHACNTVAHMRDLLRREQTAVAGLAQLLGVSQEDVQMAATVMALLHDFGKLSLEWQRKAGVKENASAEDLLAHTENREYARFPSHSTISAYALWDVLHSVLPSLAKAVLFAIAHHHSVRAQKVPAYRLHPQWREAVGKAITQSFTNFTLNLENVPAEQRSKTDLGRKLLPLESEKLYDAYVIMARWLRLADRVATEGSWDAILRYEDWFGRL